MSNDNNLPLSIVKPLRFKNGVATGISNRWEKGQYCSILTQAGIVGCGIYDIATAAEFGQAIAIAKAPTEAGGHKRSSTIDAVGNSRQPPITCNDDRIGFRGSAWHFSWSFCWPFWWPFNRKK